MYIVVFTIMTLVNYHVYGIVD